MLESIAVFVFSQVLDLFSRGFVYVQSKTKVKGISPKV